MCIRDRSCWLSHSLRNEPEARPAGRDGAGAGGGAAVTRDSQRGRRAVTRARHASERSATLGSSKASTPPAPAPSRPAGRASGSFLNEWESQQLLAPYGLPLVDTVFVSAAAAAPDAADQVGYPVVLKVCAAGLPHKLSLIHISEP